jgi:opacity protein-like surface antigen
MQHQTSPIHRSNGSGWPNLLAAVVLLASSATVMAQTSKDGQPVNSSSTAWGVAGASYIGFNGGVSDYSRRIGGIGTSNEDRGNAYSLVYGNYGINSNAGFEIGYIDFGSVGRSGGTTKAIGINLSLIGRLPLNEQFNLLAKVGGTFAQTDVSSIPTSLTPAGTETGLDWAYGIGAEVNFNTQLSAVLQYNEHYLKFAGGDKDRVSNTTVGLRYHF